MKEHISTNDSKQSVRDVQVMKKFPINGRSRIPIPISHNHKIAVKNSSPKASSCISQVKSLSILPEKRYGKDRTRLVSNYGKRCSKTQLETQISSKYRKYNWEKSKLIKQQLNYDREWDEMKVLLEKMTNVGDGESMFCDNANTCSNGAPNQFQSRYRIKGLQLSTPDYSCGDLKGEELGSVHHKLMTSNTEIFTLLKALGEQAIELYYHQTMKSLNKRSNEDVNFFTNFLKLKTKLFEVTKEGNNKFLQFKNEIDRLKSTNEEVAEKLKLTEQELVTQATEYKSMQENREESFKKIEEKLRDIIEKLQCQFRAQKLLQAKTDRELAILRSDYFTLQREKSKLSVEFTNCSDELKDCQKISGMLKENMGFLCQEKEEMGKKYEQQIVASQTTIDRLENELVDERNKNNKFNAAQIKGSNIYDDFPNIFFLIDFASF